MFWISDFRIRETFIALIIIILSVCFLFVCFFDNAPCSPAALELMILLPLLLEFQDSTRGPPCPTLPMHLCLPVHMCNVMSGCMCRQGHTVSCM